MDHCEICFLFTTTCAPSNNNVSDVESYTNVNVIQKDCMWSNECGLQQEALDLLDVNNNTLNTIAYTKPDEETGSLYNYQEDDLQELQLPVQALVDKYEDDSTDNIADCCQTGQKILCAVPKHESGLSPGHLLRIFSRTPLDLRTRKDVIRIFKQNYGNTVGTDGQSSAVMKHKGGSKLVRSFTEQTESIPNHVCNNNLGRSTPVMKHNEEQSIPNHAFNSKLGRSTPVMKHNEEQSIPNHAFNSKLGRSTTVMQHNGGSQLVRSKQSIPNRASNNNTVLPDSKYAKTLSAKASKRNTIPNILRRNPTKIACNGNKKRSLDNYPCGMHTPNEESYYKQTKIIGDKKRRELTQYYMNALKVLVPELPKSTKQKNLLNIQTVLDGSFRHVKSLEVDHYTLQKEYRYLKKKRRALFERFQNMLYDMQEYD